jgi:hypothetical protein
VFGRRLHPLKPTASQRLILERLGLVCKELPPRSQLQRTPRGAAFLARLAQAGLLDLEGPCGPATALDQVWAQERVGREGLDVALPWAAHLAARGTLDRWFPAAQQSTVLLRRRILAVPLAWPSESLQLQLLGPPETDPEARAVTGSIPAILNACQPDALLLLPGPTEGGRPWLLLDQLDRRTGVSVCPWWPGAQYLLDLAELVLEQALLSPEALLYGVPELALHDYWMSLQLLTAASAVGMVSAALDQVLGGRGTTSGSEGAAFMTDEDLAEVGTLLEAGRSLVYAAAQAKEMWDRKPTAALLREVQPLVAEAKRFWTTALPKALQRLASAALGGSAQARVWFVEQRSLLFCLEMAGPSPHTSDQHIATFYR